MQELDKESMAVPEDLEEIRRQFNQFDADSNGHITPYEIANVFKSLGEHVPGYKIRDMIKEVDIDENGTIEFNEFLEMYKKVRKHKTSYGLQKTAERAKKLVKVSGLSEASAEGTQHSFSEEEKLAFVDWINFQLDNDPDVKHKLPIEEKGDALFKAVNDGIILCKLINSSVPGTVDERTINKGKLSKFTMHENQTLAINSASSIGCNLVNIGPQDLIEGRPHLVLGLLWQVIKIGLFAKISLQYCPGLARLLKNGEELSDLIALTPEEILLRWFNHQLEEAGSKRRVHNFSKDIMDSECYTVLLNQISPDELAVDMSPLQESHPEKRATLVLQQADKMGCRNFVRSKDIVKGTTRLNLAFVANLFNTFPALKPPGEGMPDFDLRDFGETREEKTFRNWMNSLGMTPFINNLYQDLRDGYALLQLFDKVKPGCVDWTKVNKPPFKAMGGNMKKLENCNYVVVLARTMGFSVVGIGGSDIRDGSKMTLAIVWQLMRAYTLAMLQKLSQSDKPIEEQAILDWVQATLGDARKTNMITSFKDPKIATSLPVIDLVDSLRPGKVKYEIVTDGASEEDQLSNAKYAISMARKIGARVYALPEDLVEVKHKMVMTIFACLMARCK